MPHLKCADRAVVELRSGGRNEDRAAVFISDEFAVFALADGAGGVGGGAEAAEQVMRAAESLFRGEFKDATEALEWVDEVLMPSGAMSTAVIALTRGGLIEGASCGDSAAWLISETKSISLTAAQRRKPLLGDGAIPVAFGPVPFDGRLLVCSDGLSNYADIRAIAAAAMNGAVAAAALSLVQLARLRSGIFPDDVAVILTETNAFKHPDPVD